MDIHNDVGQYVDVDNSLYIFMDSMDDWLVKDYSIWAIHHMVRHNWDVPIVFPSPCPPENIAPVGSAPGRMSHDLWLDLWSPLPRVTVASMSRFFKWHLLP